MKSFLFDLTKYLASSCYDVINGEAKLGIANRSRSRNTEGIHTDRRIFKTNILVPAKGANSFNADALLDGGRGGLISCTQYLSMIVYSSSVIEAKMSKISDALISSRSLFE